MAKIFRLAKMTTGALEQRKAILLRDLRVPPEAVRASYVRQLLTCGKSNCRCRRGMKHGPFHYLTQCLQTGRIRKFLLKTPAQRARARAGIAAYHHFQERVEELSQINTELLRRGAF